MVIALTHCKLLKAKMAEAKSLGERANASRSTIDYMKRSIEAIRKEKAVQVRDCKSLLVMWQD